MRLIMTVGIYSIFSVETGECLYVGMSSVSIEKRFKQHLKKLRNKSHPRIDFVEWYHNNGSDPKNIDFRILEECKNDSKILNTLEIKWFNLLSPKYFGKKPSLNEKWEHSEETKEKIRKSNYLFLGKEYVKKFCKFCEKEITKNSAKKFCSKECSYKASRKPDKICVICSNSFSYNRERKTCSNECSAKLRKKERTKLNISKENLYEMYYNKSMTFTDITKELNCSRRVIYNYLEKFNIDLK